MIRPLLRQITTNARRTEAPSEGTRPICPSECRRCESAPSNAAVARMRTPALLCSKSPRHRAFRAGEPRAVGRLRNDMWPFKRKFPEKQLLAISESWSLSQRRHGSKPLIVRVNPGVAAAVGHPAYTHQVGVAIPLHEPDANGFPAGDESDQLDAIEDLLVARLTPERESIHVATISTGGMREFAFYSSSPQTTHEKLEHLRAKLLRIRCSTSSSQTRSGGSIGSFRELGRWEAGRLTRRWSRAAAHRLTSLVSRSSRGPKRPEQGCGPSSNARVRARRTLDQTLDRRCFGRYRGPHHSSPMWRIEAMDVAGCTSNARYSIASFFMEAAPFLVSLRCGDSQRTGRIGLSKCVRRPGYQPWLSTSS